MIKLCSICKNPIDEIRLDIIPNATECGPCINAKQHRPQPENYVPPSDCKKLVVDYSKIRKSKLTYKQKYGVTKMNIEQQKFYILINKHTYAAISGQESYISYLIGRLLNNYTGKNYERITATIMDKMCEEHIPIIGHDFILIHSDKKSTDEQLKYLISKD